jgi:hypothetical protein
MHHSCKSRAPLQDGGVAGKAHARDNCSWLLSHPRPSLLHPPTFSLSHLSAPVERCALRHMTYSSHSLSSPSTRGVILQPQGIVSVCICRAELVEACGNAISKHHGHPGE